MSQVMIIGAGIIGATIAYELSRIPNLQITVLEQEPESTFFPIAETVTENHAFAHRRVASHAALGILVGVSSQKRTGRAWNLRQASIRRYHSLIPELTTLTGQAITHNPQGLLHLLTADANLTHWQQLCEYRTRQGFQLDWLSPEQLRDRYPDLNLAPIVAGVHSPQDLQIQPTSLLRALITAARRQGVQFHFATPVTGFSPLRPEDAAIPPDMILAALAQKRSLSALASERRMLATSKAQTVTTVHTQTNTFPADWIILAPGLGANRLTAHLYQYPPPPKPDLDDRRIDWRGSEWQSVALQPVLGQALQVFYCGRPLASPIPWPAITQNDVHIVPLSANDFAIGATVEFRHPRGLVMPNSTALEQVWEQAIAILPALADALWVNAWYGLRPRPEHQPAPIIEKLVGYTNVILATGHYRNGILLAPATAQQVSTLMGVSLPIPDT
ncbi:NAD(P)/FAD-dependent oxidoreductase [Trichothermofontia sp.]